MFLSALKNNLHISIKREGGNATWAQIYIYLIILVMGPPYIFSLPFNKNSECGLRLIFLETDLISVNSYKINSLEMRFGLIQYKTKSRLFIIKNTSISANINDYLKLQDELQWYSNILNKIKKLYLHIAKTLSLVKASFVYCLGIDKLKF